MFPGHHFASILVDASETIKHKRDTMATSGYIPSELANPSKSNVYAVRYVACGLATDEGGVVREAFAYWDNQYRKWALASLDKSKAFANRFTARARAYTQAVQEWKAV